MVMHDTVERGSQCDQLGQGAGSAVAGDGPVIVGAGECNPSELVSSLLGTLLDDPWTNGLLRSVWQGQPIIVSEVVASPALLERVLAVAERALESDGRAACCVSAWMAEHNGELEDWMASMSTGRQ